MESSPLDHQGSLKKLSVGGRWLLASCHGRCILTVQEVERVFQSRPVSCLCSTNGCHECGRHFILSLEWRFPVGNDYFCPSWYIPCSIWKHSSCYCEAWRGGGMPLTCSGQRLGMAIVDILQVRDSPVTEEYPALNIAGTQRRNVLRYPIVQLAHPYFILLFLKKMFIYLAAPGS